MVKEYSKEQLWKLYEKLPQELKEAIFSEDTAENISNVCEKNEIVEGEKISEIAKYTGRVLMGILPPDEFQRILEKEVKLKKEQAKMVAREINRFVFYPVKTSLEKLYAVELAPPVEPVKVALPPEEEPTPPSGEDVYRESIE